MASKDDAFKLKVLWVKAHLDEKKPINELTLEEQLNVKANADVNSFRANTLSHLEPNPTPTVFPSTSAWITIDGCVITGSLQQRLHDIYNGTNIAEYIRRHNTLTILDM
eukprot:9679571-Ditylum_brightwellii.AAC.1